MAGLMWYTVSLFIWPKHEKRDREFHYKKEKVIPKRGKTALIVYNETHEKLVTTQLVPKLKKYTTLLVHKDCPIGHHKYTFVNTYINNKNVPVILLLTADFSKCDVCKYIQQNIQPQTCQPGKIIPILVGNYNVEVPFCLKTISTAQLNDTGITKLNESLECFFIGSTAEVESREDTDKSQSDDIRSQEDDNKSRRDAMPHNKLYLIITNMLDRYFGACRNRRHFKSEAHSKRWDHKLELQVWNEDNTDLPSGIFIQIEIIKVTSKHDGNVEIEQDFKEYVKIIEIPKTGHTNKLRCEKSKLFSYWIRFYHPPGVESLKVELRFSVYLCESKDGCSSVPAVSRVLKLATKPSRLKKSKKKCQVGVLNNDADCETDTGPRCVDDVKDIGSNKQYSADEYHSQVETASIHVAHQSMVISEVHTRKVHSTGFLKKKDVREMLRYVEFLAGDGKQDRFKAETTRYLEQYKTENRWDEYVLVAIKICALAHYKNDLEECKHYVKEASDKLGKCRFQRVLRGRLFYYKSAIYREKKLFSKANDAIQQSLQILESVECGEDTAKGYYNLGKLYMVMVESQADNNSSYKTMAINAFYMAIEHFSKDDIVDYKQIRRCLLNISRISVDCPMTRVKNGQLCLTKLTTGSFVTKVTSENIATANHAMKELRQRFWPKQNTDDSSISMRNLIQILISEAEILFTESTLYLKEHDKKYNMMSECYSKLCEINSHAGGSMFKEVKSAITFAASVERLCGNRLVKSQSEQELQNKSEVYLGDSASSVDLNPVYTSGMDALSGRDNNSDRDSDRK